MARKTLKAAAAFAGVALTLGLAACSGGGAPAASTPAAAPTESANPALKALIEKAKTEGALTITWAVYNDAVSSKLIDAFKKQYDLDIPIHIAFNDSVDAVAAKLTQEAAAGVTPSSDLSLTTSATAATIGSSGSKLIEPQDWASFSPWNKDFSEEGGDFLVIGHQFPGFIYNTNTVDKKDLPKKADDVLKMTKYSIASTPYGASFNTLAIGMGGPDAVKAHLAKFTPAGLINCGETSRIASGEFDAMWVGCGKSFVDQGVKDGAPLGFAAVSDGAIANSVYVAVPKNSAHPAAAALFGAWLNTPAAQAITWDGSSVDNAQLKGTHSADYLAKLKKDGTDPTIVNVAYVVAHPEDFSREFKGAIVGLLKK